MKLYQFSDWKNEAVTYWTNAISSTHNALYGTPASGGNLYLDNSQNLIQEVLQKLNTLETTRNNYIGSASLLDKTKDALISMVSYVTMKDITIAVGGPVIPTILTSTENWYKNHTYTLPPVSGLFTLTYETISVSAESSGYLNNQDLINDRKWYTTPPYPTDPLGMVDLYTANGIITSVDITLVSTEISGAVNSDLTNINSFLTLSQSSSKDNMIYRIYGNPEIKQSIKKLKPIVLTDYKFSNVLDSFGWVIQGINS